jgi:hypothetical protein
VSSDRESHTPALSPSPRLIAAIGLVLLALALPAPTAGAQAQSVVPAVGSYRASGRGDPPRYTVRAAAKRKAGRTILSAQVSDTCGGFATFPHVTVTAKGGPEFSAKVGGAGINGRWTTPTTIKGSVKTPCAKRQDYVMHFTG